jgi:hypothetical protein
MRRTLLAAIIGFVLGYGALLSGQNTPARNVAGAAFPVSQWTPTRITGQSVSSDFVSKNFYSGGVEIRTSGIIVHADEAVHDIKTGHVELRGTVTATLVRQQPMWPDPQQ